MPIDLPAITTLAPRLLAMAALLVASGLFSGSETALFSLNRGRRERLARSAKGRERRVARLLGEPRRLIATILVGNELVNVTFSSVAAGLIERLVPGWGGVAATLAATAVTLPLLLLFGEITPKTIALRTNERWATGVARPLGVFAWVVAPLRLVVAGVAGLIVRLLGGGAAAPAPRALGEAEFKALVDVGSEAGVLEASERRLIHRVFEFGDRTVAEVMTPARDVFSLSAGLPLARLRTEAARRGLSRIPIYKNGRDDIIGVLHAKDLVGMSGGGLQGRSVKDLLHPALYVPKKTTCHRLFNEFQKKRTHIALVVDEYGRLAGLVTMHDLLEELFGEIQDDKPHRLESLPSSSPGEGLA